MSDNKDGSVGHRDKRVKVKEDVDGDGDDNINSQVTVGSEFDDLEGREQAAPEKVQPFVPNLVQQIDNPGDVDVPDDNGYHGDDASEDDDSMSGASTNSTFTRSSQVSIQTIAHSVQSLASGLPPPDAERMLIEFVGGVYKLTVNGMNLFNEVAQTAGGYGPVASIAFISLLSANPGLLPNISLPNIDLTTISLPNIDLTSIASQIGLAADVAQAAATQAAAVAAPTGIFDRFTGAAALIGNGIMAGVTAIVAAIGTNQVVANPLTIDNIASLVESAGNKAIGAFITVVEFQNRMWTVVKKLKAKWLVSKIRVRGISTLNEDRVNQLVSDAVAMAAKINNPAGNHRVTHSELVRAYSNIVNEIDSIDPPEHVVGDIRVIPQVANDMITAAAAGGASQGKPGGGGYDGGKKNRKSQKKSRKKVTRSKRGKKAARETKKQSRRKSRGKKHGKNIKTI